MAPQEFSTCREVECPQEAGCQWHNYQGYNPEFGGFRHTNPKTLCVHYLCRAGIEALKLAREQALNLDEAGCPTVAATLRGIFRVDEGGNVFQMDGTRRVYVGVKI